jgi:hypothetical protein
MKMLLFWGIYAITLVTLLFFLSYNAKVKCEKSGGFLVGETIGKSYRLECVK